MKNRKIVVLGLMIGCLTAGSRAAMQESGAEELLYTDIPVIVEVASLFKESALEAASSVELITEKDWSLRGDRDYMEAINHYPAVHAYRFANTGNTLQIRGYATDTQERGVALLLDGIPMNTFMWQSGTATILDFDLNLLERIELIRGPGSSLYGSDAFHGVLSFKTPDPERDMVSIKSGLGANSYGLASGLISKKVGPFRMTTGLATRNMGNQAHRTRSTTGIFTKVAEDYWSRTGIFKLKTDTSKAIAFDMAYYHNAYDQDCGIASNPGANISVATSRRCLENENGREVGKVGVTFKLPSRISMETSYYYWEGVYTTQDWTSNSTTGGRLFWTREIGRDMRRGAKLLFKQPTNPLKTQWSAAFEFTDLRVTSGVRARTFADNGLPATFPGSTGNSPGPANQSAFWCGNGGGTLAQQLVFVAACQPEPHRNIYSGFFQSKTSFTDDMHLVLGTRYDDYSDFGEQWTPRAGLIFEPARGSALKYLYGRAFRAPGAAEIHGNSRFFATGSSTLAPEIIDSHEFVYMKEGPRGRNELVAFFSRWKDAIVFNGSNRPYVNRGVSRSRGLEAKNHMLMGRWSMDTGGSYTAARTVSDGGRPMEFFPRFIVNNSIFYDIPDASTRLALTQKYYTHYRVVLNSNTNPGGFRDGKPYHRTDFNVTKGLGDKMTLSLDVRNLLNRMNPLPHEGTPERLDSKINGWVTLGYFLGSHPTIMN